MLPRDENWYRSWCGPEASLSETLVWLNSTPFGKSIEGPDSEVVSNQGHGEERRWSLGHYKNGPLSGLTEVRNPKAPDGHFSTVELYERWKNTGMGWHVVRPSFTTRDLHYFLTAREPRLAPPVRAASDGAKAPSS